MLNSTPKIFAAILPISTKKHHNIAQYLKLNIKKRNCQIKELSFVFKDKFKLGTNINSLTAAPT